MNSWFLCISNPSERSAKKITYFISTITIVEKAETHRFTRIKKSLYINCIKVRYVEVYPTHDVNFGTNKKRLFFWMPENGMQFKLHTRAHRIKTFFRQRWHLLADCSIIQIRMHFELEYTTSSHLLSCSMLQLRNKRQNTKEHVRKKEKTWTLLPSTNMVGSLRPFRHQIVEQSFVLVCCQMSDHEFTDQLLHRLLPLLDRHLERESS